MKLKSSFLIILLLFLIICSYADTLSERIVKISADLSNGRTSFGTGILWESNKQVLTAYHVVMNAETIHVYYKGGKSKKITVQAINPEYDMALLKINETSDNYIRYENIIPEINELPTDLKGQMIVHAYPYGSREYHTFKALPTRDNLILSTTFNTTQGYDLFTRDIELITINAVAFSGMSGAPLIVEEKVLALLSGGYTEGATLCWFIPVAYLKEGIEYLNQPPEEVEWKEFSLVNKRYARSLNILEIAPKSQIICGLDFHIAPMKHDTALWNSMIDFTVYARDYKLKAEYGFNLQFLTHSYSIEYDTFPGIDPIQNNIKNGLLFLSLFYDYRFFNIAISPYIGLGVGWKLLYLSEDTINPLIVQIRGGIKLFSFVSFNLRLLCFYGEKHNFIFNPFGESYLKTDSVYFPIFFIGLRFNLKSSGKYEYKDTLF